MSTDTDDDYRTVENHERGCGFLEHGKSYLRSPPASASGHLPAFVEFSPPVRYLERDKFRGYEFFPGVQFELSVTGGIGEYEARNYSVGGEPPTLRSPEEVRDSLGPESLIDEGLTTTDPVGEVHRHIDRLTHTDPDGSHAGEITAFRSHDLYQHVGESYYETPAEFISEVREQGLSKAIPASSNQGPPRINPGRTRLFLVHPSVPSLDGEAGVIGYVYLHRTIRTASTDGEFPAWVQEESAGRNDFEPVYIGDRVDEEGKRTTKITDSDGWEVVPEKDVSVPTEESEETAARRNLPDRLVPSDEDGRDVKAVPADADRTGDESRETDAETVEDDEETAEDTQDPDDEDPDESSETDADDGPPRRDLFDDAEVVEVDRPEECPECGGRTDKGAMQTDEFGEVEVRVCRSCMWDNSTTVNVAINEVDYRENYEYNELRSLASTRGLSPNGNPTKDELVRVLVEDMEGPA